MFRVVAVMIAVGAFGLTSFSQAESPSEKAPMADFVGRYLAYKEVCVMDPLTTAEHDTLGRIAAEFGHTAENANVAARKWHYLSQWEGMEVYKGCTETMQLLRRFANH